MSWFDRRFQIKNHLISYLNFSNFLLISIHFYNFLLFAIAFIFSLFFKIYSYEIAKEKMYVVYFSYFIFLIQSYIFYHFYFTGKLSKSWQGVLGFHLSIEYDSFDLHPDVDLLCIYKLPISTRFIWIFVSYVFIFLIFIFQTSSGWKTLMHAVNGIIKFMRFELFSASDAALSNSPFFSTHR